MSPSTPKRRRTLALAATAVATLAGIVTMTGLDAGADTAPKPAATPYVRLFTQVDNPGEVRAVNELTGSALEAKLDELTSWYVHFHSESSNKFPLGREGQGKSSTTLASKLSERGAWVSNYRNGSYVSQSSTSAPANFGEAPDLEAKAPLAIGTFWGGKWTTDGRMDAGSAATRLTAPLDGATTTVQVRTAASRPSGTPTTWPFVNSRGTGLVPGAHSANTRDVVSWLRVDDELMQIVAEPVEAGGVITLKVVRGLWGTTATAHAAESRAFSPVYIGSTAAAAADSNLNGAPSRNDAGYPLRYAIKVWEPAGYGWIADRIQDTFGLDGYNTAWLDVSSCWQYNNSDPWGNPVFGWQDDLGQQLTSATWSAAQEAKTAGLRKALPGWNFAGNSLLYQGNPCNNQLMANVYDGGVLEHWMKTSGEFTNNWATVSVQNFDIQKGNWPGIYWVRWDSATNPDAYKRFAYGNLLLALRTTADKYQFGGPFKLGKPDELFFWNWGTPVADFDTVEQTKVGSTGLYRRDFTNGFVLVNPGKAAVTMDLGGSFFDVTRKDSSGAPVSVSTITVGAGDAAFLMKKDASTPAPTTAAPTTAAPTTAAPTTAAPTTAAPTTAAPTTTVKPTTTTAAPTTTVKPTTTTVKPTTTTVKPTTTTVKPTTTTVKPTTTTTVRPTTTTTVAGGVDTQAPRTAITSPTANGTAAARKALSVSGTATDDVALNMVRLAVRDQSNGTWLQPDGTWKATFVEVALVSVPKSTSASWYWTWTPPRAGTFLLHATAVDTSWNWQGSVATRTVKVS